MLGAEVPAEISYGAEGDRYGASVAWGGPEPTAFIAAPGGGYVVGNDVTLEEEAVEWLGAGEDWLAMVATRESGRLVATSTFAGEPLETGERVFAAGPDAVWIAGSDIHSLPVDGSEGIRINFRGAVALAADADRVIAARCEPDCELYAFDAVTGEALPGPALPDGSRLPVGEGGALALWEGIACVGSPDLDEDDGAGSVACEDGVVVEGLPGDQIGTAIAAGYAVGTFNKWVVPARARIVPLAGGEVLALENGAESQPIVLAGDMGTLVVGAPYEPHAGANAGAVYVVSH